MISKVNTILIVSLSWASFLFYFGCTHDTEPAPVDCATSNLSVAFTSINPTSCATSNGSITATATGGVAPYQFALDAQSFAATSSFSGLAGGLYILKVKDKNGCEKTTNVELKSAGSTLAASVVVTNSGCKTSTGAITVNATGGTGPYSYKLDQGTASSTNTFGSLAAKSYSVLVTDNAGCSTNQTVKVLSGIKFSTEVKSIIDTNCAISGCHVAGGSSISFTALANIQSRAGDIKSRTQSGNMPKNASKLPQAELDAIACWVDDGALNN